MAARNTFLLAYVLTQLTHVRTNTSTYLEVDERLIGGFGVLILLIRRRPSEASAEHVTAAIGRRLQPYAIKSVILCAREAGVASKVRPIQVGWEGSGWGVGRPRNVLRPTS